MYFLYSIIYFATLVFILPFEYLRRPKQLRKRWLKERLGILPFTFSPQPSGQVVWIHAVSVGEVIAAVPLIKKLKERNPLSEIVVSTVTDTGQKVAKERIGDISRIIYMPFDLPFIIRNAVNSIMPSLFIIMETELWPNTIRILNMLGVPVLLMNGRISEKSFVGYSKLRFFIKDVLSHISLLCMQNELYAERIKALGAEHDKVKITGSFKFDAKPSSIVPEWTNIFRGQKTEDRGQTKEKEFTIIAGSTHKTEEDLILDAYIKLKNDFPKLNLIIAPRHPERFKEVEELLKKKGLQFFRTSELPNFRTSGLIVLLDVIGELASVYGACDIAIIGGSFIEHGGQNPLEPAFWGKAIITGPHMENFPFINEFYSDGAAISVTDDTLAPVLKSLLKSPEKIDFMGQTAKRLYAKNAGAVDRAIKEIEKYL